MGPSGSGKDSLLSALRQREHPQLLVAHRYITRAANAGSENHIALSEQEFSLAPGRICSRSAGTPTATTGIGIEIDLWLHAGFDVLVNGSRAHLPARARYASALLPVCLQVSPDVLRSRLQSRGRESEKIAQRLDAQRAIPSGLPHPQQRRKFATVSR